MLQHWSVCYFRIWKSIQYKLETDNLNTRTRANIRLEPRLWLRTKHNKTNQTRITKENSTRTDPKTTTKKLIQIVINQTEGCLEEAKLSLLLYFILIIKRNTLSAILHAISFLTLFGKINEMNYLALLGHYDQIFEKGG